LSRIDVLFHACRTSTIQAYLEYQLSQFKLFGCLAIFLILWSGLFSIAFAETKYRNREFNYYPGTPAATYVPESQYIFNTSEEAYAQQCADIAAASRGVCDPCPRGTNVVDFLTTENDYCSGGSSYKHTAFMYTDYVTCHEPTPYVHPNGTCSDTPLQPEQSIHFLNKNIGGCTQGPSPYVK
jgi:hypothetical protein